MSRWERWTNTASPKKNTLKSFIKEQQSPAELARSMGLQSDGSGGYIDPSTGQVVARTVNNELVFYDPMGGAISAQSGGAQLTQAQPSWRDPVTGELTVPPGQAESPEEIAAIPDPVPALAPASYNAFMNAKKKEMYAMQATPEQEEIDDIQQEIDPELGMPDMGMETPGLGMGMAQEDTNTFKKWMMEAEDSGTIKPEIMKIKKASGSERTIPSTSRPQATGTAARMARAYDSNREATADQIISSERASKTPPPPKGSQPLDTARPSTVQRAKASGEIASDQKPDIDFFKGIDPSKLPGGKFAHSDRYPTYLHTLAGKTTEDGSMKELLGLDSVGAGTDDSRTGEIISMVASGLPKEQRAIFLKNIRDHLGTLDNDSTSFIKGGWVDAAEQNGIAVDKLLANMYKGVPEEQRPHVSGSAWDVLSELKALGIGGEDGEEKGKSTDFVLQTSDGKNHQISLKKDFQNRLLNQQASAFPRWLMNGVANNPDHELHGEIKSIQSNLAKLQELAKLFGVDKDAKDRPLAELNLDSPLSTLSNLFPTQQKGGIHEGKPVRTAVKKLVEEIAKSKSKFDSVDERIDQNLFQEADLKRTDDMFNAAYDDGEFADMDDSMFDMSPRSIFDELIAGSPHMSEWDPENNANHKAAAARFFNEDGTVRNTSQRKALKKKRDQSEEDYNDYVDMIDRLEGLFPEYSGRQEDLKAFEKVRKLLTKNNLSLKDAIKHIKEGTFNEELFGGKLKGADLEKAKRKLKLVAAKASKNGGTLSTDYRTAMKQYRDDFIDVLENNPEFRDGTMRNIEDYFPLGEVAQGLETMVIGDQILDKQVMKEMFGTDDWDQIKPNLRIDKGEDSAHNPVLAYHKPREGDMSLENEVMPLGRVELNSGNVGTGGAVKYQITPAKQFAEAIKKAQRIFGEEIVERFIERLIRDSALRYNR